MYEWVAPETGNARISSCNPGTNFDTLLYVRTDCTEILSQVGCNNAVGCELLEFAVMQNNTYYIVVDGQFAVNGDFELSVSPPPSPVP